MGITQERVRTLIHMLGHREVAEATGLKPERLKTIRYNKDAQVRTNELDAIAEVYKQYSLWLRTGEIDITKGQISPAYVEADLNLAAQKTGSR